MRSAATEVLLRSCAAWLAASSPCSWLPSSSSPALEVRRASLRHVGRKGWVGYCGGCIVGEIKFVSVACLHIIAIVYSLIRWKDLADHGGYGKLRQIASGCALLAPFVPFCAFVYFSTAFFSRSAKTAPV